MTRRIAALLTFIPAFLAAGPLFAQDGASALGDGLTIMVVCFVLGILLLLAEIFLIPGFGVTGIGGIALVGASCYVAFTTYGLRTGALVSAGMILVTAAVGVVSLKALFHSKAADGLIHRGAIAGTGTPAGRTLDPDLWIGRRGETRSDLRPVGKVDFEGEILEVKAESGLVQSGRPVEVIRIEENRPVVRSVTV